MRHRCFTGHYPLLALALAFLFITKGSAEAATGTLSCPAGTQPGAQFTIEVLFDVGTTPLGAYTITLTYNPTVVTIASVSGGSTQEFSGTPTTNSSTFTSGSTRISGFQSSRLDGPTGVVSVAHVTFNTVATMNSSINLGRTVNSLFDTNSNPITPVTVMGCMVSVTVPTTTATSSTTSTTTTSTTSTTTTTTQPATTSTTTTSSTTSTSTSTSTSSTTTSTSTTTTSRPTTTTAATTTSMSSTTTTTIGGNNVPLDCTDATAVPSQLWPPDHELIPVSIVGVTDPDGDAVTITITGVTQDEPVDVGDGGNPCPDATGVGGNVVLLRAERDGSGDGRVYHIAFTATDGRGAECTSTVMVCVPHDQGHGQTCGDQGPLFDSTAPNCAGACNRGCAVEMELSQPVCSGENLPAALTERLSAAQQLAAQAAGTTNKPRARRLMRRSVGNMKRAARIAARAAKKGEITRSCAVAIASELHSAKVAVGQSPHSR